MEKMKKEKGSQSWNNSTHLKNKSPTKTRSYNKIFIFKAFGKNRIEPGSLSWSIAFALRAKVPQRHTGSNSLTRIPYLAFK